MSVVVEEIYWIAWREVRHYFRSRLGMVSRIVQAATWLVLVGAIFSGTSGLLKSVGFEGTYFQYITPGVIVMIVIFGSIFGGMTTIWDRRFGYFQKQTCHADRALLLGAWKGRSRLCHLRFSSTDHTGYGSTPRRACGDRYFWRNRCDPRGNDACYWICCYLSNYCNSGYNFRRVLEHYQFDRVAARFP